MCGVKVLGRKRILSSTSYFKREIHELECLVNLQQVFNHFKGKGEEHLGFNLFSEVSWGFWFVVG